MGDGRRGRGPHRLRPLLLLLLLAGLSGHGRADQARTISIQGSELLGSGVVQAWQDYARDRGVAVDALFRGSRPARDRLAAGVIDMAVLIDDGGKRENLAGWVSFPLAHVAAWVVVPRELPLQQLDYADLTRIFGANSPLATTRWGDFGATGKWEYVPVSMHVMTAATGLAHEIFLHEVLRGQAMKSSVRRHDAAETVLVALAADEGGVAVMTGLAPDHPKFRALLISPPGDEVAFGPSAENMEAGDYPLAIPLRLVVARERVADLLPVLQYWYRDEMTAALAKSDLMPLPRSVRNQQVFDLEVIN